MGVDFGFPAESWLRRHVLLGAPLQPRDGALHKAKLLSKHGRTLPRDDAPRFPTRIIMDKAINEQIAS